MNVRVSKLSTNFSLVFWFSIFNFLTSHSSRTKYVFLFKGNELKTLELWTEAQLGGGAAGRAPPPVERKERKNGENQFNELIHSFILQLLEV